MSNEAKRNPKTIIIGVAIGLALIGLAAAVTLTLYAGSQNAKSSLLVKYFRALSSGDPAAVSELVSPDFESELGLTALERGSYELYDFGYQDEGTIRFLLVAPGVGGEKRAVLADMVFSKYGLGNRIDAIRRLDEGRRLKE